LILHHKLNRHLLATVLFPGSGDFSCTLNPCQNHSGQGHDKPRRLDTQRLIGLNPVLFNGVVSIMNTLFGILTVEQWLAILRIGIGLWWLKSVLHKPLRKFVSGQMAKRILISTRPTNVSRARTTPCSSA
jgi:hypothetical protein